MKNVEKFKRGADIKLTENFHLSEFECGCGECEETLLDMNHIEKLQALRTLIGRPIEVTSGYRCEAHNKAVGGSPNSQHKNGTATDIKVQGVPIERVEAACEFFDGLGRYETFTHIDSRGYRARWGG
jgi:uncharacterized protein YcbK (DUF882 family)